MGQATRNVFGRSLEPGEHAALKAAWKEPPDDRASWAQYTLSVFLSGEDRLREFRCVLEGGVGGAVELAAAGVKKSAGSDGTLRIEWRFGPVGPGIAGIEGFGLASVVDPEGVRFLRRRARDVRVVGGSGGGLFLNYVTGLSLGTAGRRTRRPSWRRRWNRRRGRPRRTTRRRGRRCAL
jgi:hypothetical protein